MANLKGLTGIVYRAGRKSREALASAVFVSNTTSGWSGDSSQEVLDEILSDDNVAKAAAALATDGLLSTTVCDAKTAATTSLYIVPASKILILTKISFAKATASLAGGVDYDIGEIGTLNWKTAADLSTVTTAVHVMTLSAAASVESTYAATKDIGFAPQTGSTLAANVTVLLYGYLIDA